jgi:hypothetical protein
VGDGLEAARGVEARSDFMGDRLVLDEAMFPSCLNSFFVKVFGIEVAAFDPRNFGRDQCRAILKILGAILRPHNELPVMGGELVAISDLLLRRYRVVLCRPGKCVKEKVFSPL